MTACLTFLAHPGLDRTHRKPTVSSTNRSFIECVLIHQRLNTSEGEREREDLNTRPLLRVIWVMSGLVFCDTYISQFCNKVLLCRGVKRQWHSLPKTNKQTNKQANELTKNPSRSPADHLPTHPCPLPTRAPTRLI